MLLPSLTVGLLGTFAYITWFASFHLSELFSAATGRIGVVAAAGASLVLGTKTTRLLLGSCTGKPHRMTSWLIILIVSGIIFLLFLDAITLCRM